MKFILQPWQLMLIILASWVNRQQQEVIENLRTENAVLKEKFGEKRILLTDDQRCRLTVKGKLIGRKQLRPGWDAVHAGHNPAVAPSTCRQ